MMRRLIQFSALAASAFALGACKLDVQNPNNPETARVLASPNDVESLLGSYYLRWHAGMYGSVAGVWGMANVQSFENYSSLNNNLQNARAGIPRPANDNSPGNLGAGDQFRIYSRMNEVNRVATDILVRIATDPITVKYGDTTYFALGAQGQSARTRRAQAFAEFLRGVALGYLAMTYDSTGIISPTMGTGAACDADPIIGACRGQLRGYKETGDSAIAALTRAIAFANMPATGTGGFPLPSSWIPSSVSFSAAEFVKLVRSYRARIRANVARTPAEAANPAFVDWTLVIADATNGISADHNNITNSVSGPFDAWIAQYELSFGLWHQMTPFIIGMADTTSAYDAWTKTALDSRAGFHMATADLRFPQGQSRAQQQADFAINAATSAGGCDAAGTTCKRYYRNRPSGEDQLAGLGWGLSEYDFARYYPWARRGGVGGTTGQNGQMIYMTKAEMDLLAAEGYYRTGDLVNAAALINVTRTRGMVGGVATGGGLPAVTATLSGGLAGATCIPKKPTGGYGPSASTACGDLWEALKYEKRLETQFTHFAAWLFDSRRWGDLVENTPLHWATPYDDLLARGKPTTAIWSTGGTATNSGSAAKGTYGW